jgi:hypothetical protein
MHTSMQEPPGVLCVSAVQVSAHLELVAGFGSLLEQQEAMR